jgi:hypothetical protein
MQKISSINGIHSNCSELARFLKNYYDMEFPTSEHGWVNEIRESIGGLDIPIYGLNYHENKLENDTDNKFSEIFNLWKNGSIFETNKKRSFDIVKIEKIAIDDDFISKRAGTYYSRGEMPDAKMEYDVLDFWENDTQINETLDFEHIKEEDLKLEIGDILSNLIENNFLYNIRERYNPHGFAIQLYKRTFNLDNPIVPFKWADVKDDLLELISQISYKYTLTEILSYDDMRGGRTKLIKKYSDIIPEFYRSDGQEQIRHLDIIFKDNGVNESIQSKTDPNFDEILIDIENVLLDLQDDGFFTMTSPSPLGLAYQEPYPDIYISIGKKKQTDQDIDSKRDVIKRLTNLLEINNYFKTYQTMEEPGTIQIKYERILDDQSLKGIDESFEHDGYIKRITDTIKDISEDLTDENYDIPGSRYDCRVIGFGPLKSKEELPNIRVEITRREGFTNADIKDTVTRIIKFMNMEGYVVWGIPTMNSRVKNPTGNGSTGWSIFDIRFKPEQSNKLYDPTKHIS